MSNQIEFSVKAAIAVKTARTALGLSQVELSDLLGIAKTTLARVETLEAPIKIDTFFKTIEVFKSLGIELDVKQNEDILIRITHNAQQKVVDLLANEANRRADKKTKNAVETS
jgi:transcriptional regulator with XRE-family HTH domain